LRTIEAIMELPNDAVPTLHRIAHICNRIHKKHPYLRWSIRDNFGLLRYDGHQFFVSNTTGRLIRDAGWIGAAPQSGHYRKLGEQGPNTLKSTNDIKEANHSIERLRKALKDNGRDPELEDIYLSGVSDEEIEVLINWLQSENIQRVIEACIIIRRLGVEQTLPYLVHLLDSHAQEVQRFAINALGQIGNKNTLRMLREKKEVADDVLLPSLTEAIASISSVSNE
jgi:hypothetical protein